MVHIDFVCIVKYKKRLALERAGDICCACLQKGKRGLFKKEIACFYFFEKDNIENIFS